MTALKGFENRGMLKDTLVLWLGEFGRTPDNNRRGGVYAIGRGHNNQAMTILMAGGGVKPGSIVGATDELGAKAVEVAHPIRDLHATLFICSGWMTTSSPSSRRTLQATQPVRRTSHPRTDRLIFFRADR